MITLRQSDRLGIFQKIIGGPAGFRQLLEQQGPTFIKIGQFLALRPDLVPQEYCDELMRLFDRVPAFPWPEAQAIVESEFGCEISSVFSYIDPVPIAAGSLAQVHRARLPDGTQVAVKIRRPNIEQLVRRDIRRARRLVRFIELSGASFVLSPREALDEVSDWLLHEIDFSRELANLTRLHSLTADDPNQKVPRPYPEYSTGKILTTEYIQGVSFSDLLSALRPDPGTSQRPIPEGINPEKLAENLLFACLTQIFRYQFFHADLHPGNLIALPGNVIGFVDFGLCDELDPAVRQRQLRYLYAVYMDDAELMYRALIEILIPGDDTDFESFRRDFLNETATWQSQREEAVRAEVHGPGRSPTGQWMIAIMRAARRHGFRIPPRILSMYRALLTAEAVAGRLGPEADVQSVGQRFFQSLQWDEVFQALNPEAIPPYLLSILSLVQKSPGQLDQLLSELAESRFSVNTVGTESPRTERVRNRRARIVVSAVASVSIAMLLTRPSLPIIAGIDIVWPLVIVLVMVYLSIFIQLRGLR
jgi:ubiquinone biosynthesis protein